MLCMSLIFCTGQSFQCESHLKHAPDKSWSSYLLFNIIPYHWKADTSSIKYFVAFFFSTCFTMFLSEVCTVSPSLLYSTMKLSSSGINFTPRSSSSQLPVLLPVQLPVSIPATTYRGAYVSPLTSCGEQNEGKINVLGCSVLGWVSWNFVRQTDSIYLSKWLSHNLITPKTQYFRLRNT